MSTRWGYAGAQKILVDQSYRKTFKDWVESGIAGREVEIASRPPSSKDFVPVKWRWVSERSFAWLNCTGDPVLPKTLERLRENPRKFRSMDIVGKLPNYSQPDSIEAEVNFKTCSYP